MSESVNSDKAPRAVGHYPHARRVGPLLFLSGIGPRNASDNSIPGNVLSEFGSLLSYDIVAQCHSVFGNVRAVLEASGAQWGWNGGKLKPTFSPSVLDQGNKLTFDECGEWNGGWERDGQGNLIPYVCHSYVTDGRIQFLGDCTHVLSGQTVDLPDWEG